jgi:hypothetical protein
MTVLTSTFGIVLSCLQRAAKRAGRRRKKVVQERAARAVTGISARRRFMV